MIAHPLLDLGSRDEINVIVCCPGRAGLPRFIAARRNGVQKCALPSNYQRAGDIAVAKLH
jgi:hypothetical protein